MIKGCQKKIIFLKNTGCDLFEEAYFIMKDCAIDKGQSDIVLEATKIVNNLKDANIPEKRTGFFKRGGVLFLLGAITGVATALICYLLFT